MRAKRLGLTMRVDRPTGLPDPRDALSQDWPPFLRVALCEVPWIPIPNLGQGVESFLEQWEIDAVILTGGNDIGESNLRDETERVIVGYCSYRDFPVLGVCRGLHLLQDFYGGRIRAVSTERHLRTTHRLQVCCDAGVRLLGSHRVWTNSFHRQGVRLDDLSPELEAWMISEDGLVEGVIHRQRPQLAVQWHPEREMPDSQAAVRLLRYFSDA